MVSRISYIAAGLCAIMILSFMSGILHFFGSLVEQAGFLWKLVYYGFWISALVTSIAMFLTSEPPLRNRLFSVILLAGLMIAVALGHAIDDLMKNYIMIVLQLVIFTILAATTRPGALLMLGLWIVVLNAAICMLDIMFPAGFSNTLGRAAGLMVNPNVAALSLLLGASATFVIVPPQWRYSFIVLIAAAIFTTMSRSTMLLGLTVTVGSIAFRYAYDRLMGHKAGRISWPDRRAVFVATAASIAIFSAAIVNDRVPVAASSSFGTAKLIFDMIGKMNINFSYTTGNQGDFINVPGEGAEEFGETSFSDTTRNQGDVIAALGERAEELGETNSMMARKDLMLRALYVFKTGPWYGSGLSYAHEMAPHNTFLLFAVAFGYPGLFLSCGLLLFAIFACGWRHMELPLALGGAMMVSHDILMPVLIAPLVIGLGFHLANRGKIERPVEKPCFVPLVWCLGLGTCVGTLLVVTSAQPLKAPILPKNIRQTDGTLYLALVPAFNFSGLLKVPASNQVTFELDGATLTPVLETGQNRGKNGVYDIWGGYLIQFTSVDGSNPQAEDHRLSIGYQPVAHDLAFLLVGVMVAWTLTYSLWGRRGRP